MSDNQLKALIAAMAANPSLRQQLRAEGADPVAIANAAGFAIEAQQLLDHLARTDVELSEAELETAAGGMQGKSSKKDACNGNCNYGERYMTIPPDAGTLEMTGC